MKNIALGLLVCMAFLATGCPKKLYETQPSTNFKRTELNTQVNDFLSNRQMAYYCSLSNKKIVYNVFARKYDCGDEDVSEDIGKAVAKRIRDEALEQSIAVVNSVYGDFIDDLNTGRATTNFVADVIDLGLGAAVGIVKGERPLQILGVALTAFRGGRKSIDLNFFREQTVPILVNKMDDNRAKVYGSIIQKKIRSVDEYRMEEAVRDIVDYFNAGTLVRAFAELAKDTATKAKSSEDKILRLKGLKSLDDIPSANIIEPSINIFTTLRDINAQITNSTAKTQEAGKKRIELIYAFITKDDAFKDTIKALREKGDQDVIKPIFEKIDGKKELSATETFEFVYGIYEFSENNLDLTQKLEKIVAKTLPE